MEPISLILGALGAGAAAAAEETAAEAVKDAYRGLKGLLRRLFGGRPDADAILDDLEKHPKAAEAEGPLREALEEAGAADDPEVVEAAQKVMAAVDPEGAAAGKFSVTVAGSVQGQVVGDHAEVTMNFGPSIGFPGSPVKPPAY